MHQADKQKVSEEAKKEQITSIEKHYDKISRESQKQTNIAYNEKKDLMYSTKNGTAAVVKVYNLSKEAESSERLKALTDNAAQTTENLKFVLEGLGKVEKA